MDKSGRLINQSSTDAANNVVLELVDGSSNSAIKVGDASQSASSNAFVGIYSASATLPYSVRYYATGQATAGAVTSSVTYTLIYE